MITILMATYNGSSFVEKQLESIRNQSIQADRVYILDDCSTDSTYEIVKDYIQINTLNNWRINQNATNQGHYKTFIELTKMVDEGFVFFSDQDDIWDFNKIETMLPVFNKENVSMVFCKSRMIDESDRVVDDPNSTGTLQKFPVKELLKAWPSGYQSAYRAEVLKDVVNNNMYKFPFFQFHDVLFGMLSCIYGDVMKLDIKLDSHRIHLNNVTLSSNSKSFHNTLSSRLEYYEKMFKRYEFLYQIAIDSGNSEVEEVSKVYHELYLARYNFIRKWDISSLFKIYQLKSYYNGRRAFGSDIVYALRLNAMFGFVLRKFRRNK